MIQLNISEIPPFPLSRAGFGAAAPTGDREIPSPRQVSRSGRRVDRQTEAPAILPPSPRKGGVVYKLFAVFPAGGGENGVKENKNRE